MIVRSLSAREERGYHKLWLDRTGRDPDDLIYVNDIDADDGAASCLSSFSYPANYQKLPQKYLVRLSVLKLDGSRFDVHIMRHATVGDLKRAIEDVFRSIPTIEPDHRISWSDVWDHFCLCYNDRKLLNNKAYVRSFGIKDGDKLIFTRYIPSDYAPMDEQTKPRKDVFRENSMSSPGRCATDKYDLATSYDEGKYNGKIKYADYDDDDYEPLPELKVSNCLRGWFSYAGLCGVSRRGSSRTQKQGTISLNGYHSLN